MTFYAYLNGFVTHIACFSICTIMQSMVVYGSVVYIGLNGSAVDHSDPQSEKAHTRTPVHPTVAFRSGIRFIERGPEL